MPNYDTELRTLNERRNEVLAEIKSIKEKADGNADAQPEAEAKIDTLLTECETLRGQIRRLDAIRENEDEAEKYAQARDDRESRRIPKFSLTDSRPSNADDDQEMGYEEAWVENLRARAEGYLPERNVVEILKRGEVKEAAEEMTKLQRSRMRSEQRAQTQGTNSQGGFLVPESMMPTINVAMSAFGPMWNSMMHMELNTPDGGALPIPATNDTANRAEVSTEGVTLTDDGGKDFAFTEIVLNEYMYDTEWVRLTIQLLSGSYIDIENLLGRLLGERLGRTVNKVLTDGDGSSKPRGVMDLQTSGQTLTTAAGRSIKPDELIDLYHMVDPAYRIAPKFCMMVSDATLAHIAKMKDTQNRYLVEVMPTEMGRQDGETSWIQGGRVRIGSTFIKYAINQEMTSVPSTSSANNHVAVIGDFDQFYVRKIGGIIVGSLMDKDFWPGVGIAGYVRFDADGFNTAKRWARMTMKATD